jgi:hypothetical protein
MGLLYGRAGRLTAQNGGFRRGQYLSHAHGVRLDTAAAAAAGAGVERWPALSVLTPTCYDRQVRTASRERKLAAAACLFLLLLLLLLLLACFCLPLRPQQAASSCSPRRGAR